MKENNYLGKERVGKLLLQFAIPSTLALVISCLYNIVDQIFVGNGIGYLGNAATGMPSPNSTDASQPTTVMGKTIRSRKARRALHVPIPPEVLITRAFPDMSGAPLISMS